MAIKKNPEMELRVASYCVVGLGLFAAIWYISWRNEALSEVAAWVQAIGSIAAIWGAFVIGERQVFQANRFAAIEKKKHERLSLVAVMSLLDRLEGVMAQALKVVERKQQEGKRFNSATFWNDALQPLLRQLDAVPLHQYPYSTIAAQIAAVPLTTSKFVAALRETEQRGSAPITRDLKRLVRAYNFAIRVSNHVRVFLKMPSKNELDEPEIPTAAEH